MRSLCTVASVPLFFGGATQRVLHGVAFALCSLLLCKSAQAESGGMIVVSPISPAAVAAAGCSYSFCKNFQAIPHASVFAVAVWYVNSYCQSLGTGTFSFINRPQYGSVTYATADLVPYCSTKPVEATVAYYQWTAPDPFKFTDDSFSLRFAASNGGPTETIGLDAVLPQPTLRSFSEECADALRNSFVELHLVGERRGSGIEKSRPMASFKPRGGLTAVARKCGFRVTSDSYGFDWVQTIAMESAPGGYPYTSAIPYTGGCSSNLVPPFNDPPQYGYCGKPGTSFNYPFYYSTARGQGDRLSVSHNQKTDAMYCPHDEVNQQAIMAMSFYAILTNRLSVVSQFFHATTMYFLLRP